MFQSRFFFALGHADPQDLSTPAYGRRARLDTRCPTSYRVDGAWLLARFRSSVSLSAVNAVMGAIVTRPGVARGRLVLSDGGRLARVGGV